MSDLGLSMRQVASVVLALLARPRLWPVAVSQTLRLARPGWWRELPPVPLPPGDYLRFRLVTAYGGHGALPDNPSEGGGVEDGNRLARDVVAYLRWCRAFERPPAEMTRGRFPPDPAG